MRLEEVNQFAADLDAALIYNFRSCQEFMARGVGVGILHQGTFVSGASSAAVGRGKLEIEIQTHRQFRRRGLARAVAAALILYCLEHGIEACWDAANEPSAALARQVGFHSTGKYEAYRLKRPGRRRRTLNSVGLRILSSMKRRRTGSSPLGSHLKWARPVYGKATKDSKKSEIV